MNYKYDKKTEIHKKTYHGVWNSENQRQGEYPENS